MTQERRGFADFLFPALAGAALLGVAHVARLPQTLGEIENRLRLQPTNAALHSQAAWMLLDANQPAAAAPHFASSLAHDPGDTSAAMALATIYLAQGRPDAADKTLRATSAAITHRRDAALHLQFAALFAQLQDYTHASIEYNSGTALDPQNDAAYSDWGMMLLESGEPEKAATVLRQALQIKPNNAAYHVALARALRDSGLFTQAMDEFTLALDNDIKYVPAYRELAATFERFKTEEGDKSAEYFLRKGIEAAPDDMRLKIDLALLLRITRDPLTREKRLWEAATLLQNCVEKTDKKDLNVLRAAAQAWSDVGLDDTAESLIQDALTFCRANNAPPDQIEGLLKFLQRYVVNQNPHPGLELTPPIPIDGMPRPNPLADPWPVIKQPSLEFLIHRPGDLSQVPGPGGLLDPALYSDPNAISVSGGARP